MENAPKRYDAHLEEYRKIVYIKSMEEYKELYRRSLEDVDNFWGEAAKEYISWYKDWDFVLRYDFEKANIEWFGGGVLNVTYNCLDRHLDQLRNKVAYYWEADDPAESRVVTYLELYKEVNKFAAGTQGSGHKKGRPSDHLHADDCGTPHSDVGLCQNRGDPLRYIRRFQRGIHREPDRRLQGEDGSDSRRRLPGGQASQLESKC